MSGETDLYVIPVWCEGCNQQGEIFVESETLPCFVRCSNCGHETASVWCETCGAGGEYVRDIQKRPTAWKCEICKTDYALPIGFYEHSVELEIIDPVPYKSPPEMNRFDQKTFAVPQPFGRIVIVTALLITGAAMCLLFWVLLSRWL